jgi:hypothetical protein
MKGTSPVWILKAERSLWALGSPGISREDICYRNFSARARPNIGLRDRVETPIS